jgi:4-amino-4-deoxy-L-arabinose transferase-like glycosyltransferase
MQVFDAGWDKPIAVTLLLLTSVFGWLAWEIPKGTLSLSPDELLTAERSREMLLFGRSEVHFDLSPSFEKPPLQYWLTSLTLPRFNNKTLAVRIWPWFYGVLTAISLAWLAFLVEPGRPWLVPLSVAVLASCPLFSAQASRALLDTGLAFFTTVAIAFAQLARKNPAWWLGVAAACWLGSLQKIPLTFLVWLLILTVRLTSPTERQRLRSSWLLASILGALVTMAIWPAVQLLEYEVPLRALFQNEVVDWLGPGKLGARPYLEVPYKLIITSACGVFLLLAPFAVLFWRKEKFFAAAKEISLVCLALIALEVFFNFRHVRYIEPIIPALCLLLAIVLYRLLEQPGAVRVAVTLLLGFLFLAGFVQTKLQLDYRCRDFADEKRVAEELGAMERDGTHMVLIREDEATVGRDLSFDSFYLFHGALRWPIAKYTVDEIRRLPPPPPLIGVCIERDFPVVQTLYPSVQIQFTRAQFILWRVE